MHWAWKSLNVGGLLLICFIIIFISKDNGNMVEDNTILKDLTLNNTNDSIDHTFTISDINKLLSIAVYAGSTYDFYAEDADLRTTILDSSGQVLFEKVFTNSFYSNIQFNKTGVYTLLLIGFVMLMMLHLLHL